MSASLGDRIAADAVKKYMTSKIAEAGIPVRVAIMEPDDDPESLCFVAEMHCNWQFDVKKKDIAQIDYPGKMVSQVRQSWTKFRNALIESIPETLE